MNLYGSMMEWTKESGLKKGSSQTFSLEPDILADDLQRYKMLCSKDFNMSDLLKLKEIQALALLAEAIIDLPEYLTDKVGKMRLGIPEHTITGSLDEIGNALNVISESI